MARCHACGGEVMHPMAKGGYVHEEDSDYPSKRALRPDDLEAKHMPEDLMAMHEDDEMMDDEMDDDLHDNDIVKRILKSGAEFMSRGGKVANATPPLADSEDAEYDDLVKDDDLEFSYTGKNSGDELGDEQEDDDRHDIVKRIMKSRMKKDRMPHPA